MIVWNAGPASADTLGGRQPLIGEFMSSCKLQSGTIAHATAGPRAHTALVCYTQISQLSVCVYDDESDACHNVGAGRLRLTQFRKPGSRNHSLKSLAVNAEVPFSTISLPALSIHRCGPAYQVVADLLEAQLPGFGKRLGADERELLIAAKPKSWR